MKKLVFKEKVRIIAAKKISQDYFSLALGSKKIACQAVPGQFVQIKDYGGNYPLLRRPFGIHRVKGKTFDILCQIVGPGTKLFARKKAGDFLDLIGPLGNGFTYHWEFARPRCIILVAGGMGVAPLTFLAEKLKEIKNKKAAVKTLVLLGAKNKTQVLCAKEFRALGCEVKIATDNGSMGFKGYVTDLLKKILQDNLIAATEDNQIYACGPRPMLEEVASLSREFNIPAQISLEEHLACGIGACLGCVVNTREGFKRICKEGPVFWADEIVWK